MRFKISYLNKPIDAEALPSNFPDVLQAAFALVSQDKISRDTGLNRSRAKGVFRGLQRCLRVNDNGTYRTYRLDEDQAALCNSLTKYIVAISPPTADRLAKDFVRVLAHNELIDASLVRRATELAPALGLFTVAAMHSCRIELGKDDFAELRGWRNEDGEIDVTATALVQRDNRDENVGVMVSIFSTHLNAQEWCDKAMLEAREIWERPLEVTDEPKLRFL